MTPDRIKFFLRSFYQAYILSCYERYEIEADNELEKKVEQYDIQGYFFKNLDIYVENCDFLKEYQTLYNPKLFAIKKEDDPELFNDLQIFLIENIQLFLHTILETGINSYLLKTTKIKGIKLYMKVIDNTNIKLIELIDQAEEEMKNKNILPPAMG